MSQLYTGTPALKTDFTRTGKRTRKGAMNDGINSVTRYYINNFTDGQYCDCLDFLTQRLTAESDFKKRAKLFTPMRMHMIGVLGYFAVVHFAIYSVLYSDEESLAQNWYFEKFLILMTAASAFYSIMANGRKFIDDSTRF